MNTTTHSRCDTVGTHDDLVDHLVAARAIRNSAWEAAFRAIPPHQLLNRTLPPARPDGPCHHHDVTDPTAECLAYTDSEPVTGPDPVRCPEPACRRLIVLARMLDALALHHHHRVLHIGTDTGYATALLRHRLRTDTAATAILRPNQTGHPTTNHEFDGVIVARDSTAIPEGTIYDRIIATSSVPRIPPTWIQHTRSGGVIVASIGHGVVRLTVTTPGTATGHFLRTTTHRHPSPTTDGTTTQHDHHHPPRHIRATASNRPARTRLRADVDDLLRSLAGPHHEYLVTTSETLHAAIARLDPRWARPLPVEPQDFGLTVTSDGKHTIWLGPQRHPVLDLAPTPTNSTTGHTR
ncbi:MAG TPA: hypothetical protein VNO31_31305 [Umezawaea sp.]|nr:hypothetical protein [Umezawaea sp.]